jgi:hypothetical protein
MKVTDKDYYMDGILATNMEVAKKLVTKDWDCIGILDGLEREGKSTLAQQMAYFVDPTFNIDRIVFSQKAFEVAVGKAEKGQAIVMDEAMNVLFSRQAMSSVNIGMVKNLAHIGQKNLFIIFCLPSFFELDRYAAIHRSRFLIHVYCDGLQRGYFSFFNRHQKKDLYINGKVGYKYNVAYPSFRGRFGKFQIINDAEYRAKKLKALIEIASELKGYEKLWGSRFATAIKAIKEQYNLKWDEVASIIKWDGDAKSLRSRVNEIGGKENGEEN